MTTPIAAIDCGTNSIKLLIARMPQVLVRESRVVRLGQGVDTTGELAAEALERTFAAIEEFARIIADHGITGDRIRFCATSASRDARNAQVFTDGVRERLGVTPEVITGPEEAALVFAGATRTRGATTGPTTGRAAEPGAEPVLVVDIGGGSTELVTGAGGEPTASVSLDIGSVRLTERHLHGDPPTPAQIDACVADIDAALDSAQAHAGVDIAAARTVIGTSGTVKTITAGLLDLDSYDPGRIDGATPEVARCQEYVASLVAMSVAERRALPYMHPGRADVIGAGALIWSRILHRARVERFVVSEADILHGIAWSITE